jgi:hypothetical protein
MYNTGGDSTVLEDEGSTSVKENYLQYLKVKHEPKGGHGAPDKNGSHTPFPENLHLRIPQGLGSIIVRSPLSQGKPEPYQEMGTKQIHCGFSEDGR